MNDYLPCVEHTTGRGDPDAAVIWLHGLGASGHDFEPIIPELGLPASARVRFVFPHAPSIPVTVNGGYVMPAWYDIVEMTIDRQVDAPQLLDSARRTQDLISREIARGIDSRRIVVAGFSQGGAVAYEAALSCDKPLAGLLALSTYLATADSLTPNPANRSLPVHIYHGSQDQVVPFELGKRAQQHLQGLGYEPEFFSYPMGHEVCLEQVKDLGQHIRHWLTL